MARLDRLIYRGQQVSRQGKRRTYHVCGHDWPPWKRDEKNDADYDAVSDDSQDELYKLTQSALSDLGRHHGLAVASAPKSTVALYAL
jgi:hypothetical protein